jgi:hypothetical protein
MYFTILSWTKRGTIQHLNVSYNDTVVTFDLDGSCSTQQVLQAIIEALTPVEVVPSGTEVTIL